MAEGCQLSGPAMEIAGIVFRLGTARVRDVRRGIAAERAMDFSTVQTYPRR